MDKITYCVFSQEDITTGIHLCGLSRRGQELALLSWVPTDVWAAALQRMQNQKTEDQMCCTISLLL